MKETQKEREKERKTWFEKKYWWLKMFKNTYSAIFRIWKQSVTLSARF